MHSHFNVFDLQLRPFTYRQRRCGIDRVGYLLTVHFDLADKLKDIVNFQIADIFTSCTKPLSPKLEPRGPAWGCVLNGQVDSRFDGCIEALDAIRGEKYDILEIFEMARKTATNASASD
jgi:hypothetical protein